MLLTPGAAASCVCRRAIWAQLGSASRNSALACVDPDPVGFYALPLDRKLSVQFCRVAGPEPVGAVANEMHLAQHRGQGMGIVRTKGGHSG